MSLSVSVWTSLSSPLMEMFGQLATLIPHGCMRDAINSNATSVIEAPSNPRLCTVGIRAKASMPRSVMCDEPFMVTQYRFVRPTRASASIFSSVAVRCVNCTSHSL